MRQHAVPSSRNFSAATTTHAQPARSVLAACESLPQSVVLLRPCRRRTRSPPPIPAWVNPVRAARGKTEQNLNVRATLQSRHIADPLRSFATALGSAPSIRQGEPNLPAPCQPPYRDTGARTPGSHIHRRSAQRERMALADLWHSTACSTPARSAEPCAARARDRSSRARRDRSSRRERTVPPVAAPASSSSRKRPCLTRRPPSACLLLSRLCTSSSR